MSHRSLVIGTRGSRLALWQAEHVLSRLLAAGHPCELRIIRTQGDQVALSFDKMEGKGFFTKELEAELLAGTIDLAVHSCKDLETRGPDGLHIAAIAGRAACEELLIIRSDALEEREVLELKRQAVVGTSSARRKSQLRMFRPDLVIADLRGNVPTRVEKLRNGEYDAILLAKAGIDRLGLDLSGFRVRALDPRVFVPAPAQGALAIQTRRDDERTNAALQVLHDGDAARITELERQVLFGYHGGCQVPLGVHAERRGSAYSLWASAARTWDAMPRRVHLHGTDVPALAEEAVRRLQEPSRPLRVLITREVDEHGLMRRVLNAHNIGLSGASLLVPRPMAFRLPSGFDRLFFSSRNAVRHFVRGGGSLHAAPCDAIGVGTAEELRTHGIEAGFVGDGPDSHVIAVDYVQRFGAQRVLFPCAEKGLRTVQSEMPAQNVQEVHVYAMRSAMLDSVPETDVVIVTSPDHANALHAVKPLGSFAHRIAMGTSTAKRIRELSGAAAHIPWASNETALIDAVFHIATQAQDSWS